MEQFYAGLNALKPNIGKNNPLLSDKRYDELDLNTKITKIKTNNEIALNLRINATNNLEIQANKMKKLSDKKLLAVEIGSTVRIPVPDIDKGRLDVRNILSLVTETSIARSQFTVCQKKLLHLDEVPAEELALRSVASQQSIGSGQGFTKCTRDFDSKMFELKETTQFIFLQELFNFGF
ncbi:hypothetical protein QTP88_025760 [Uroleucon formosanum]